MQPNQPTPEQGAPLPPTPEQAGGENRVETVPAQEQIVPRGDQQAQGDLAYTTLPLPQPLQPPVPVVAPSQDDARSSQSPVIADDVDLIEKEWVDKAKTIVNEHKHDPYNQEKEVGQLQADYLQKRYGKSVKASE